MARSKWERVYGERRPRGCARGARQAARTSRVGPLSAVVYRSKKQIPRSRWAPPISLRVPAERPRPARGARGRRRATRSTRSRSSRRPATGRGRTSAPTTTRPTASSTTSPTSRPARPCSYRAIVLDNAGHTRSSAVRSATSRRPRSRSRRRTRASACAASVEVRATAAPEHSNYVVRVRALGERRPVHHRRHGRLLARLHRVRRHVGLADGAHVTLPRRAHLRARAGPSRAPRAR